MWDRTVFLAFYTTIVAQSVTAARFQHGRFLNTTRPATSSSTKFTTLSSTTLAAETSSQHSSVHGLSSTPVSRAVAVSTPSSSPVTVPASSPSTPSLPTLLSTLLETKSPSQGVSVLAVSSPTVSSAVVASTPRSSLETDGPDGRASTHSLPSQPILANPTLGTTQNVASTLIPIVIVPAPTPSSLYLSGSSTLSGSVTPDALFTSAMVPVPTSASVLTIDVPATQLPAIISWIESYAQDSSTSVATTSTQSSLIPSSAFSSGVPIASTPTVSPPVPLSFPTSLPTGVSLSSVSSFIPLFTLSPTLSLPLSPTLVSIPTPLTIPTSSDSNSHQDFSSTPLFPLPTPTAHSGLTTSPSSMAGISAGTSFAGTAPFSSFRQPSTHPVRTDSALSGMANTMTNILSLPTSGPTAAPSFPIYGQTTVGNVVTAKNSTSTPTDFPFIISGLETSFPTATTPIGSFSPSSASSILIATAPTPGIHNTVYNTTQPTLATSGHRGSISTSASTPESINAASKTPSTTPTHSASPTGNCILDSNLNYVCLSATPSPTSFISLISTSTSSSSSSFTTTAAAAGGNGNKSTAPISKSSIAGIAVAVPCAIILAVIAALYLLRRHHNRALAHRSSSGVYPELAYLYDPPMPARIGTPRGPSGGGAAATSTTTITRKPVGSGSTRSSPRAPRDSGNAFLARYTPVLASSPHSPAPSPLPRSPHHGPLADPTPLPLYSGDGYGYHFNASDDIRPHFGSMVTLTGGREEGEVDEAATLLGVPSVDGAVWPTAQGLKPPPARYVPDSEMAGPFVPGGRWEEVELGDEGVRAKRGVEMGFADPRLVGREF